MKNCFFLILYLTALFPLGNQCFSQGINQYNINIYNGLPSNNVYNLTIDRYGYLWIPTDKGVARYNGYEVKTFDPSNGFVYKDIWRLYEDRKGRMWLYSISDNIGYIYKDKYHSVVYQGEDGTFYPRSFYRDYKDGVYFIATFSGKNKERKFLFCVEKNDTLHTYELRELGVGIGTIINDSVVITVGSDRNLYRSSLTNGKFTSSLLGSVTNKDPSDSGFNILDISHTRWAAFRNCIVSYRETDTFLRILYFNEKTLEKINFNRFSRSRRSNNILMLHDEYNTINIITEDYVYKLDDNFQLSKSYPLDSILKKKNDDKISHFIDDTLWGKVFGTFNNGIYITYNKDTLFKKVSDFDLADFLYVGSSSDSVCFWWNKHTKILAKIEKSHTATFKKINTEDVEEVIPFNGDSCFVLTLFDVSKMDINTMSFSSIYPSEGTNAVVVDDKLYIIARSLGFFYFNIPGKVSSPTKIDNDLYKGLAFDSKSRAFLAYNHSKILIYKEKQPLLFLDRKNLERMGLNSIEKIATDNKYGNIFIQEGGRLVVFTDLNSPYYVLFGNYILRDAKVTVKDDNLIVAGAFGVLFSKITGLGAISKPVVYPNTKMLKYSIVNDMQVAGSQVMLNTDRGLYQVGIPGDDAFARKTENPVNYKLIVTYNDNQFDVSRNDTIQIYPKNSKLLFDIINPTGYGKVKYVYRLAGRDSVWHDLSANELSLPKLQAGAYFRLSLIAYDEQWKSNERIVYLYIVPYWWQEPLGEGIIWTGCLILAVILVYIIVMLTKRNVNRLNAKKQYQMELELKSVYAQINPHFIFNSLSVAMYLIKTKRLDDAFQHILKFSHLLRSYITSSRNRFTTVDEEIINLKNYIELQQARFKDRFEYEIIVDPLLDRGAKIPSLLLQPIVENAIAHGLLNKDDKGHLKIEFQKNDAENEIICIIDDDGVGRDKAKRIKDENSIKNEAYGGTLVNDLIRILNEYEKIKIAIEYIDKVKPLTGTTVKLSIKDLSI